MTITDFDFEDCSFYMDRRTTSALVTVTACTEAEAPYITIQTTNRHRNRLLYARSYYVIFLRQDADGSSEVALTPADIPVTGLRWWEGLRNKLARGYGDWRSERDVIDALIAAEIVTADNVAGSGPEADVAVLTLDKRGTMFMRGASCNELAHV